MHLEVHEVDQDAVHVGALRETETETETDRFSINRKPTNGRFSKRSVFGFPDSSRFCLLRAISPIFLHVFLQVFSALTTV
jgi:hypothetical protein